MASTPALSAHLLLLLLSRGGAKKSKVILLLDLLVRIDDPIEHPLHIAVPILRRLQRDRDQRHPRRRLPRGR